MSTQRTADPEGSSNGHRATKISSQAGPLNYYKGFIAGVFSGISKCLGMFGTEKDNAKQCC